MIILQEVEPAENIIESLLPVLSRWLGDDVLAIFAATLNCTIFETNGGRRREAGEDFLSGQAVYVYLADGRSWVRRVRSLLRIAFLLLQGVSMDGEGAIPG